ncbi:IS66 family transposase [Parabacteroides sp.]
MLGHVRAKYKDAEVCGDPFTAWFVERIGQLYLIESECLLKRFSPAETLARRRGRDVTNILDSLRSRAEELLSRSRMRYSETLRKSMVYMLNGWDNLVRYREDGEYAIDNNLAERSIRPLTNNRKNSLFYGSERGVEMAVWFHSLVETGKARGLNLKNWMVSLIRELMRGNKDYEGLLQDAYI